MPTANVGRAARTSLPRGNCTVSGPSLPNWWLQVLAFLVTLADATEDQRRHDVGGLAVVAGQGVRVDRQGEAHRGVPEPLAHDLRVDAGLECGGGVAVP